MESWHGFTVMRLGWTNGVEDIVGLRKKRANYTTGPEHVALFKDTGLA